VSVQAPEPPAEALQDSWTASKAELPVAKPVTTSRHREIQPLVELHGRTCHEAGRDRVAVSEAA
jgi:hypothetical protein